MATPITQRVKSAFPQNDENKIVANKGKLGFNLENKVAEVQKNIPLVEASEGKVTGQMAGDKMSDDDWNKYLAQESPERKAERLQQQTDAGVREGVVTQSEADTQNAANVAEKPKEYGNFQPIELENQYRTNQSRSEAMNQVRRNRSLQRNIKRENNKARRGLNKAARKGDLTEQQTKDLKYYNDNRYTSGSGGNAKRDANGNIIGSNLENGIGDLNQGIGDQTKISGGNLNSQANRDYIQQEGIITGDGSSATTTQTGDIETVETMNQQKSSYKQTPYSGFQQNPKSPKKQAELLDQAGKKLGNVSKTGSFSKVSSAVGPVNMGNAPKISGGTKLLNKGKKVLGSLPDKGKFGLVKKVGLGLLGLAGAVGLVGGAKRILSSDDGDGEGNGNEKESTKKTPYVKPGGKATGRMKDYALNSKARSDEYDARGWKHDATSRYKRTPKPAVNTLKSQPIVKVGGGSEIKAQPLLNKVAPVAAPVSAPIDNKQKKAIKKIGKLEGRNQTSKRDIRIAKQKDKAAGLSRKQVKANKLTRKSGGTVPSAGSSAGSSSTVTMPRVMNSAQYNQAKNLGGGSAIDAVKSGAVTIESRENELKAATGFKQKGWKGFQK